MAHFVLVLAVVAWSFSFLGAARLRQDLGLTEALAARFVPVLIGAGLVLLWRRPLRLPRGSWTKIAAMALLGVPGYHLFFLVGATLRPPFVLGGLVLLLGVAAIVLPVPRWPAARLSGRTS